MRVPLTILVVAGLSVGHADQISSPNASLSVQQRLAARSFPSIFQAWNGADNLNEDPDAALARHDLYWHVPEAYGLQWEGSSPGLATGFLAASIAPARALRERLLVRNPNMILIASLRYRDAPQTYLPADHRWWRRDRRGARVHGWEEGGYFQLDWDSAEFRARVVTHARAVVDTGVVDGILLDQWHEEDSGRLALVRAIREAIGPDRLIIVNPDVRRVPKSAPYVNGMFLENCFEPERGQPCRGLNSPSAWKTVADLLLWAEKNLRAPRVNALEGWFVTSRNELNRMRATTTLALTHADGYALFSDPNDLPVPDHRHDWYRFWDFKSLGKPIAPMTKRRDGAFQREFAGGTVVYNPQGNRTVMVTFPSARTSAATGGSADRFTVDGMDGDLFLK
jgi:hypothetical protein